EVACAEQVSLAFPGREVHFGQSIDVHGVPLNIHVAEVAARELARNAPRIKHLPEGNVIPRVHRRDLPMRRNLPQPRDAGVLVRRVGLQPPRAHRHGPPGSHALVNETPATMLSRTGPRKRMMRSPMTSNWAGGGTSTAPAAR